MREAVAGGGSREEELQVEEQSGRAVVKGSRAERKSCGEGQQSCGEGQQSRRVAVKGNKRVELQVEQQRTVRRKIELISNR